MPIPFPDGDLSTAAELGAVDDRSVRVWFRQPNEHEVVGTLSVDGRADVVQRVQPSAERDWTGVLDLSLEEAAPDAAFTFRVGNRTLSGRFTPIPGTAASLTFGFGSCHMPFVGDAGSMCVSTAARGLYSAMQREMTEARSRLLLLTGDQIYADERPGISVRDDLTDDDERPPSLAVALDAYRRNYRGFFNESGMRALRDSFPTLMMWDDHDILDNWGSTRKRSPLDELLFTAASHAYAEYQHNRNPPRSDGAGTVPPFDWTQTHGNIGVLALDLRGARDPEHGTMLGIEQMNRIEEYLSGEASLQIDSLFVLASVPIAHVSRWFTTLFDVLPERFSELIKDRWLSKRFIASRDALLDALFDWQQERPERQVIVLSGDVHCASAFTIRQRSGPGVIQQVTSSALSTPFVRKLLFFNRVVFRAPNLLEPRYRFERHFLSLTHNFGIVRTEPLPTGGHRVVITIRGWQPRANATGTVGRVICVPEAR